MCKKYTKCKEFKKHFFIMVTDTKITGQRTIRAHQTEICSKIFC